MDCSPSRRNKVTFSNFFGAVYGNAHTKRHNVFKNRGSTSFLVICFGDGSVLKTKTIYLFLITYQVNEKVLFGWSKIFQSANKLHDILLISDY